MKNSEVEAALKFYRQIDADIEVTKEWLEQLESGYNPLGAVSYDGVPHGTGQPDQTGRLAIKLADEDTGKNVEVLKKKIQELKTIRTQIFKEISELKPLHKAIICGFYIQGRKWEHVAGQIGYTVRHTKNIRCEALKALGEKLERNKNISQNETIKDVLR